MSATVDRFVARQGRRPRILVAREADSLADDAAQLSVRLADAGMDVDVAPACEPGDLARQALENDADGVAVLGSGAVLARLDEALVAAGADHVLRVQALSGLMVPSDAADLVLAADEGDPAAAVLEFLD